MQIYRTYAVPLEHNIVEQNSASEYRWARTFCHRVVTKSCEHWARKLDEKPLNHASKQRKYYSGTLDHLCSKTPGKAEWCFPPSAAEHTSCTLLSKITLPFLDRDLLGVDFVDFGGGRTAVEVLDKLVERALVTLRLACDLILCVSIEYAISYWWLTVPSELFWTKPVTPTDLACLTVNDLYRLCSALNHCSNGQHRYWPEVDTLDGAFNGELNLIFVNAWSLCCNMVKLTLFDMMRTVVLNALMKVYDCSRR